MIRQFTKSDKILKHKFKRAQTAGHWLSAIPNHFNGHLISSQQFFDNIRLRYSKRPVNLPDNCPGSLAHNSIQHALNCKTGGLIEMRHDEVADEWHALGQRVFGNSKISHEPEIFNDELQHQIYSDQQNKSNNTNENDDEVHESSNKVVTLQRLNRSRGDKSILGFWQRAVDCIFDIRIMDLDCKSYRGQDPQKVLNRIERAKCNKYKKALQDQNKDFTPMVYSVDGMPGHQTNLAEKRMAALLASSLNREYSEMMFYVRARMTISIVRCNTILLRATRVKAPRQLNQPDKAVAIDMGFFGYDS